MEQENNNLSFEDKENIKKIVLENLSKQDLDELSLANKACSVISYINDQ